MLFIYACEVVHLFIYVVHFAENVSEGQDIITLDHLAIDLVGSIAYSQDETFEI